MALFGQRVPVREMFGQAFTQLRLGHNLRISLTGIYKKYKYLGTCFVRVHKFLKRKDHEKDYFQIRRNL